MCSPVLVLLVGVFLTIVLGTTASCDITNRGAVGDGKTLNTKVIQDALDDGSCQVVVIPKGRFLTSALNITRDNIIVSIVGTLLATTNRTGWHLMPPIPSYPCERDICSSLRYQPVLLVFNASNVSIVGSGSSAVVDGQGPTWWKLHKQHALKFGRPRLLETMYCKRFTLRKVELRDSPFWSSHFFASDGVEVDRVRVHAPQGPNTDGFDPDSARNVWIHDCTVDNGDDCVAIKSGMDEAGRAFGVASANILVERLHCIRGDGVSVGSEMSGGVENVTVRHVSNALTNNGVYIKTSVQRGGYVRNVSFSNISFEGTETMVKFRVDYQSGSSGQHVPVISDISFSNLRGAGLTAGSLACSHTIPCSNITMTDVRLIALRGFSCSGISGSTHNVHPKICY